MLCQGFDARSIQLRTVVGTCFQNQFVIGFAKSFKTLLQLPHLQRCCKQWTDHFVSQYFKRSTCHRTTRQCVFNTRICTPCSRACLRNVVRAPTLIPRYSATAIVCAFSINCATSATTAFYLQDSMPLVSSYIILRKVMVHVQRTSITTPNDFLNDCVICPYTTTNNGNSFFGVAILRWLFELHVQHTLWIKQ